MAGCRQGGEVEEKGSDVNLASHLLLDAFQNNFDVAAVLSNDSDLVEPIRIVTQVLGKPVGLLSPVSNPTPQLRSVASFLRHISVSDLGSSQFPVPLIRADGWLLTETGDVGVRVAHRRSSNLLQSMSCDPPGGSCCSKAGARAGIRIHTPIFCSPQLPSITGSRS